MITRILGLQYLWMDSLCIIQDSLEDWNLESGLIDQTYGYAALCIAAEASGSSGAGIFRSSTVGRAAEIIKGRYISPSRILEGPLWFRKTAPKTRPIWGIESRPWILMEGPLSTRAWTLQENFFSSKDITI